MGTRGMDEGLNDVRIVTYGAVLLRNMMTASSDHVSMLDSVQNTSRDPASPTSSVHTLKMHRREVELKTPTHQHVPLVLFYRLP